MGDRISCPHCRRVLQMPAEYHGRQVRCPECQEVFVAGAATDVTATAPKPGAAGGSAGIQAGPPVGGEDISRPATKRWYEADDDDGLPYGAGRRRRFTPGGGLALVVKVMLALNLLASIVILGSQFMQYQLATRLVDGVNVPFAELQSNNTRQMILRILHFVVYAATGIIFVVWFHGVHVNLEALGARDLTYTSGWAAGCWFVPILNLFRPVQIAQEIWRNSDPSTVAPDETGFRTAEDSSLIGFWWASWIVSLVLSQITMLMTRNVNSPESLQTATLVAMIAEAVRVVAAILALALVNAINARQMARAAALAAESEYPPGDDDSAARV